MDINKIDKIDTNLVLPSIQDNLMEIERDKWGNILNEQTFKTLNNNMRVLKEVLLELVNEINITDLERIKLRLNNLETDRDSIESIVDNNTNNLINVGITERKLNLKGTELEFNGNKIDTNNIVYNNDLTVKLTDYAKLNKDNSFAGKITSNEIKSNSIETNELKVNGKNVITDTSNFAKLNTTNDFTQKIKGTDIESNKLIANELILNGINVNLSDYSTNNNVIKQIEKVAGLDYGGDIQDIGNKVKGKFYFDSVTKSYYECIENTDLTYNESTKFRAISNKPISDRLENLFNFKTETLMLTSDRGTQETFTFIVCGSVRIIYFSNITVKNEYETKFVNIPDWFCKNAVTLNFSAANGSGGAVGEVAECYFNATERSLSIFPSIRNGHIGNLQMSGQGITVARI